ncbi:sugar phosphate isomerase/epimerase family protein [Gorillibacterium sp. sgz5001074]|uniref:sugar phosphate isomerase/epimerase family protein n=1 Tax=Gorillibacterium sp. sgz5001074 TaxID=3446695 RepID=UPI003F663219
MKLSVFTVVTPDLTPEELVAEAQAAGLDGIEWRYKEVPEDAKTEVPSFWRNNRCSIDPRSTDEELERFRRITAEHGLELLTVTPYLNVDEMEATEQVFRAAQKVGARMIRVGVPGYNKTVPYPVLYEKAVAYLRAVEPMARKYGVKGLVETHHHTIAPSASAAYRLVSHCDPEHIGVLFDPGNMVHEGFENFRMGLELLGPYLAHVHIKNTGWVKQGRGDGSVSWSSDWFPLSEGVVDYRSFLEDLKAVGYDGYLGIEDFSRQYGSRELLHAFAKHLRELV